MKRRIGSFPGRQKNRVYLSQSSRKRGKGEADKWLIK
jgi:hypothetical protein